MRATLNQKLTDSQYPDLTVESSYGINDYDQNIIESINNVESVDYSYQKDVLIKDSDFLVRIESMSELPLYQVVEGRLPEKKGEISLDKDLLKEGYKLGEMIDFVNTDTSEIQEDLLINSYEIVGFITSSEYLMDSDKGRSNIGKGNIDGFAIINSDNFNMDYYGIARIKISTTTNLSYISTEYKNLVNEKKAEVEKLFSNSPEVKLGKIVNDANKEIDKSKQEISDAESEISDAESELNEAQKELYDGFEKYAEGKKELEAEKTSNLSKLEEAKSELEEGKLELTKGESDYKSGLEQFEKEKQDGYQQIKDGKEKLEESLLSLEEGWQEYQNGIDELNKQFAPFESAMAENKELLDENGQELLVARKNYQAQVDQFNSEITEKETELNKSLKELEVKNEELFYEGNLLASDKDNLTIMEDSLASKELEYNQTSIKLENTKKELEEQQKLLNDSFKQKEDQKAILLQELEDIKNSNLSDLEKEQAIKDKEEEISTLETEIITLNNNQKDLDLKVTELNKSFADLTNLASEIEKLKASVKETSESLLQRSNQLEEQRQQLDLESQKLNDKIQELETEKSQKQALFEQTNKELESQELIYQQAKEDYETGLNDLANRKKEASKELTEAKLQLDQGQAEYDEGVLAIEKAEKTLVSELEKASQELEDAKNKLSQGWSEYETGLANYQNGKKEFEEEIAKAEKELKEAYQDLIEGQNDYQEALTEFNIEKKDALSEISEGKLELADAESEIAKLKLPSYTIKTPSDDASIYLYQSNSESMDMLSYIFPIFFYAIAMLVTVTTMSRMVDEERIQIGTLKALGYEIKDILKKYLLYGLFPAALGSIIGIVIGYYLLSNLIFNAYSSGFNVGEQVLGIYPYRVLVAFILSLALVFTTVFLSIKSTVKNNPATLLRPKSPKIGSKILLERIRPLWNHLSFLHKVTLRNIFRYKARMLMTIIGIAGCTGLLFMGFAIKDSITQISPLQYNEIINYDLLPIIDENASENDINEYETELLANKDIDSISEIRFDLVNYHDVESTDQDVSLVVAFEQDNLSDYIDLRNRKSGDKLILNDSGVIISEKIAEIANVKVGDYLIIEDSDSIERQLKVAGITENYINHYIYLTANYYQNAFEKEALINGHFIKLSNTLNTNSIVNDLVKNEIVLSVINNVDVDNQIGDLLDNLNLIVFVLILISSLLAIVVLYNLTNINISERIRELSTIKVLGFYNLETTEYVYRETFLLSIIGIVVGYGFGFILHWFIINVLAPDSIMMSPNILMSNYVISALITLTLSLLVMIIMHNKLKKVNMVEALKGVE